MSESNIFKQKKKKVNGLMISLPLLMFESRSCQCASLTGAGGGMICSWAVSWQGQFLYLLAKVTIQTLPSPSGTALEREGGEQGGRQGKQIRPGCS